MIGITGDCDNIPNGFHHMFKQLLIANRGEIACRIIKTARRLGISTIAIYSTADRDSVHVKIADRAFCIGEPEARLSYLNIDAIIAVALQSGADAIHPGYGFLSENPDFVRACQQAGIQFVGPTQSAMEAMASKQLAKQLLAPTQVPLTPGYHGLNQSDETLLKESIKIGFPVLLKAANGGGGKGMRAVLSQDEFASALAGAKREALACFGDDIMIIEKYISDPRHIEIQIMADQFGNTVHLFERDCSIQRRHQKIIEEAPAPQLSPKLSAKLCKAALEVASTIQYLGAGTVEFLVDGTDNFYFMEMNTRLQVEHPVTEMITGLDLVEWQLRIAAGEPLPCKQENIKSRGHAIECRIYAEDPHQQFLPSTGIVQFLKEPQGEGIRIDTGIQLHSEVSQHYDPMIAKLIVYGSTRAEAIQRLSQALKQYWIAPIKTNIPMLQAIILNPEFIAAHLSTHFLTQQTLTLPKPSIQCALFMAAAFDYLSINAPYKTRLQADTFAWQMHLQSQWMTQYQIDDVLYTLTIFPIDANRFNLRYLDETVTLEATLSHFQLSLHDGEQLRHATIDNQAKQLTVFSENGAVTVMRFTWQHTSNQFEALNHQLTSPMPATVVALFKQQGDNVKLGEPLIVLEAMKMEHTLLAPNDGIIGQMFYRVGEQVSEGAELVELLPIREEQE
jgi:3-methylcrotonyl-CoA carboxylase alpha subunit